MSSKRSLPRRLYTLFAEIFFAALLIVLLLPVSVAVALRFFEPPTSSIILQRTVERAFDRSDPIYPYHLRVPGSAISIHLKKAVVASEDGRFFQHSGFDLKQIEKAIEDHNRGRGLRGASTISQQIAKNLFLWEGRSVLRKGLEAYLTVVLELVLSKERLLEIYLNIAEWGDGIFGAEAASIHHYGKSARALTADEAARMAVILPNPREWKPRGRFASERAKTVRARMQDVPIK